MMADQPRPPPSDRGRNLSVADNESAARWGTLPDQFGIERPTFRRVCSGFGGRVWCAPHLSLNLGGKTQHLCRVSAGRTWPGQLVGLSVFPTLCQGPRAAVSHRVE